MVLMTTECNCTDCHVAVLYLTDRRLRENAGENMDNIYSKDLLVSTYKVLSLKCTHTYTPNIVTDLHIVPAISNALNSHICTYRHTYDQNTINDQSWTIAHFQ